MQQVGLAETGGPVDEQRVVGPGRVLGDRERGRVGEAVRGADDEAGRTCSGDSASRGLAGLGRVGGGRVASSDRRAAARAGPVGATARPGRSRAAARWRRRARRAMSRPVSVCAARRSRSPSSWSGSARRRPRSGTARTGRRRRQTRARTPRNHVFQVASASWARNAVEPVLHRSSAARFSTAVRLVGLSTGPSTGVEKRRRARTAVRSAVGRPRPVRAWSSGEARRRGRCVRRADERTVSPAAPGADKGDVRGASRGDISSAGGARPQASGEPIAGRCDHACASAARRCPGRTLRGLRPTPGGPPPAGPRRGRPSRGGHA